MQKALDYFIPDDINVLRMVKIRKEKEANKSGLCKIIFESRLLKY